MWLLLAGSLTPSIAQAQPTKNPRHGLLGPFFWTNPEGPVAPEEKPAASQPLLASQLFRSIQSGDSPPDQRPLAPPAIAHSDRGILAPFYWTNPPKDWTPESGVSQHSLAGKTPPSQAVQVQFERTAADDREQHDPFLRLTQAEKSELPAPDPASRKSYEELAPPPPDPDAPSLAGSGSKSDGEEQKSLADAEQLGEEPEDNSLQFLRADTVLLDPGETQYDVGVTYSLFEDTFTAIDVATGTLVEAEMRSRQLVVPVEIRYGLTRRSQLFIGAPFGWAHNDLATENAQFDESDVGIGDITAGLSFVIFDHPDRVKDTVATFAVTLPTGDDPFTGSTLTTAIPALGNGFYAVSGDLLFIKAYDPVVFFYGLGFRHNFASEFNGVDIRLGNEYRGQLGIGFAVNQDVTLSTRFNFSFFDRVELDGSTVPGSALEPFTLRFAATVAKDKTLVEPFVQVGTTEDAASTSFGVSWTF